MAGQFDAGELDRRVTIQRFTEGDKNEFGEAARTWLNLGAPIWAQRRDVSDAEKVTAGQRDTAVVSRFKVRSSERTRSVTPVDRLVHDGATWAIKGVKEAQDGRRRFIEITAVKDHGA